MKRMDVNSFVGLLLLFVLIPPACAAIQYEVIDLGANMTPIAISDNGKVLLSEQLSHAEFKLYIWEDGQSVLLDHVTQSVMGFFCRVNIQGQVIANFYEESSFAPYACFWTNGQKTIYDNVMLWDLNNHGQILAADSKSYVLHPDGTKQYLEGPSGTPITGVCLNDYGQAAGMYNEIGILWNPDGTTEVLSPLGGDFYSCGLVMNNQRQVLGHSTEVFHYNDYDLELNLVLWDPIEGLIDLDCTYGFWHGIPYDMNDQGQVVGMLKRPGDGDFKPYLWQQETGFINLGDLVQGLDSVHRINDLGEIIGSSGGHGVLLIPVPEPGSVLLILLGVGLLRRHRKS